MKQQLFLTSSPVTPCARLGLLTSVWLCSAHSWHIQGTTKLVDPTGHHISLTQVRIWEVFCMISSRNSGAKRTLQQGHGQRTSHAEHLRAARCSVWDYKRGSLTSECRTLLRDLLQTGYILRKLIYGQLCFNAVFSEQQVHVLPPTSVHFLYTIQLQFL